MKFFFLTFPKGENWHETPMCHLDHRGLKENQWLCWHLLASGIVVRWPVPTFLPLSKWQCLYYGYSVTALASVARSLVFRNCHEKHISPQRKECNKIGMALKMFTKTIVQLTRVLFSSIKIANSHFFSGILKSRASSDKDGLLRFSKHSTALLFFLKILKSKIWSLVNFLQKSPKGP